MTWTIDIHVHLLQLQPSRLASKILPHPYSFLFCCNFYSLKAASKPALKHPERLLVLLQVRIVETCRSCFAAISRAKACLDSLLLALHSAGDLEACLEACFIFILYTYICFAAISTASPCFTPASRYALGLETCLEACLHTLDTFKACFEALVSLGTLPWSLVAALLRAYKQILEGQTSREVKAQAGWISSLCAMSVLVKLYWHCIVPLAPSSFPSQVFLVKLRCTCIAPLALSIFLFQLCARRKNDAECWNRRANWAPKTSPGSPGLQKDPSAVAASSKLYVGSTRDWCLPRSQQQLPQNYMSHWSTWDCCLSRSQTGMWWSHARQVTWRLLSPKASKARFCVLSHLFLR